MVYLGDSLDPLDPAMQEAVQQQVVTLEEAWQLQMEFLWGDPYSPWSPHLVAPAKRVEFLQMEAWPTVQ